MEATVRSPGGKLSGAINDAIPTIKRRLIVLPVDKLESGL